MEYVSSVSWLLGWEPCSGWLHLSVIVVAQESKVSIRCYVGGWCWWAVATPPPLTDAGRLVVAPHHTTTTMFCVVSQFSYTETGFSSPLDLGLATLIPTLCEQVTYKGVVSSYQTVKCSDKLRFQFLYSKNL